MRIDVLTIFPEYVAGPADVSLLGRSRETGVLDLRLFDLRDAAFDRHRSVDDAPYGGGAGMVMRPDVVTRAVEAVWNDVDPAEVDDAGLTHRAGGPRPRTILFTPRGRVLDQALVRELSAEDRLVLLCGRYEGIDERVHDHVATDEVSIGDVVTFGGEVAALVLIEAVVRLLPDAMGNAASPAEESFSDGLLEHPQYTRPAHWRGHDVPEILRSGDHARIAAWQREQRLALTRRRRPDLLAPTDDPAPGADGQASGPGELAHGA
ncbi:tRNA (guanosine(37)-N1)-methyltransferase TrmD [Salsipaludibacter albus]|uniref:tRNA (guanosine(37)-N1)-methyltransferase TrmD n=1 Tax=Salsipaludibacter albus TaxID=2849650 RepID=UPI001EE4E5B6|nr:tRNA (guanosine(37)-N1)-methyltransferase TrmD [Salsipaludibacter albus]